MAERSTRTIVLASLALATVMGAICAALADAHWTTAMLLLTTPFAGVIGLVGLVISGVTRFRVGVAMSVSLLAFWCVVQVWPTPTSRPPTTETPKSPCADEAPPARPIRVATWNTHGKKSRADARELAKAVDADLLLLQEVGSSEFVDEIARQWDGEAAFSPTLYGYGLGVVVRGGELGRCFGKRRRVVRRLPAAANRKASAMLVYARLHDGGTVPVVVFHNDRPAGLSEVPTWPRRLAGAAVIVGELAVRAGSDAVIVGGDANAPHYFRRFGSRLTASGLTRAQPLRTWPVQVRGVRLLPVYAIDGLWSGAAWHHRETRRMKTGLESDHRMLTVHLE